MVIWKEFKFEAAHKLEGVPPGHKCARLHGHSYRVRVHVRGGLDRAVGWVMDFADLKRVVTPVIEQLDHRYLNDIPGLEQSTAERIAVWIYERIKPGLAGTGATLDAVEVMETRTSGAVYRGE